MNFDFVCDVVIHICAVNQRFDFQQIIESFFFSLMSSAPISHDERTTVLDHLFTFKVKQSAKCERFDE